MVKTALSQKSLRWLWVSIPKDPRAACASCAPTLGNPGWLDLMSARSHIGPGETRLSTDSGLRCLGHKREDPGWESNPCPELNPQSWNDICESVVFTIVLWMHRNHANQLLDISCSRAGILLLLISLIFNLFVEISYRCSWVVCKYVVPSVSTESQHR